MRILRRSFISAKNPQCLGQPVLAWGSQCIEQSGAASASSAGAWGRQCLGQPELAWGSQRLPGAANAASRQQGAPLQSIAFAIHILAKGEAGKVRVQQLRQTLGQNLKNNAADQEKVGFIIVDFGSTSEHYGDTIDSIIKAQAQVLAI